MTPEKLAECLVAYSDKMMIIFIDLGELNDAARLAIVDEFDTRVSGLKLKSKPHEIRRVCWLTETCLAKKLKKNIYTPEDPFRLYSKVQKFILNTNLINQ